MKANMPFRTENGVRIPIRAADFGGFARACDISECNELAEQSGRTVDKRKYFCAHHFFQIAKLQRMGEPESGA